MPNATRWKKTIVGTTVAALVALTASTAWAGYMNWQTTVDVPERTQTEFPVDGKLLLDGEVIDTDYKPKYEDPEKSTWVRMTVYDPSGNEVSGSLTIKVGKWNQVNQNERRADISVVWQPDETLQADTRYDYDVEARSEGHGNPSYTTYSGSLRTVVSGDETDAGTTEKSDTGTGANDGDATTGGPGPDAGSNSDASGGQSNADTGVRWSDGGNGSGTSSGNSSDGPGSGGGACSQSAAPSPANFAPLVILLLAGWIRRRLSALAA